MPSYHHRTRAIGWSLGCEYCAENVVSLDCLVGCVCDVEGCEAVAMLTRWDEIDIG